MADALAAPAGRKSDRHQPAAATAPSLFTEAEIGELCRNHFCDIRDAAGAGRADPRGAA